jgi:hypothetical protein
LKDRQETESAWGWDRGTVTDAVVVFVVAFVVAFVAVPESTTTWRYARSSPPPEATRRVRVEGSW